MEPREFILDTSTTRQFYEDPKRRGIAALACGALLLAGLFIMLGLPDFFSKITGFVLFVAGLVAGAAMLLLPQVRKTAPTADDILVADTAGLTWASRRHDTRVVVPTSKLAWSNVTTIETLDSATMPIKNERFRALCEAMGPNFVGIVPIDFETYAATATALKRVLIRTFFDNCGVLAAGPVLGMPATELRDILERYRTAER